MDHISLELAFPEALIIALFFSGIAVLLIASKWADVRASTAAFVFALVLTGAGILPLLENAERRQSWEAALRSQISESYKLEISEFELYELLYPATRPEEDFKVYGSFERSVPLDKGFELVETFLVWQNGEMMLAESKDSKTFTEIGAK